LIEYEVLRITAIDEFEAVILLGDGGGFLAPPKMFWFLSFYFDAPAANTV
jgi:hypothetical protein